MVSKGLPIKHLGKLDGQKGANLGLWMVAKALRSGHPQKVAFPLYLAVLRTAQNWRAFGPERSGNMWAMRTTAFIPSVE
jgi:hypothetical protein